MEKLKCWGFLTSTHDFVFSQKSLQINLTPLTQLKEEVSGNWFSRAVFDLRIIHGKFKRLQTWKRFPQLSAHFKEDSLNKSKAKKYIIGRKISESRLRISGAHFLTAVAHDTQNVSRWLINISCFVRRDSAWNNNRIKLRRKEWQKIEFVSGKSESKTRIELKIFNFWSSWVVITTSQQTEIFQTDSV